MARRTDEIIDLLRACWRDDPVTFAGAHYAFDDLRILPKPAHDIPIWVGGGVEAAYRRGVELGDGFQLIGLTPEETVAPIARLRGERPEPAFVISLRTGWDPEGMEHDRIRREYDEYAEPPACSTWSPRPWRTDLDDWLRSMDTLAGLVALD